MALRRYPRDFGLGARMVTVMFLLAGIYVALVAFLLSLGAPALFVVLVAAGMLFFQYWCSDRGAAVVTGSPSTLAAALVKVTGQMGAIPTRDLRAAEPLNAFYFAPARARGFSLSSLFATHPSLERRLEQLKELERTMGGA